MSKLISLCMMVKNEEKCIARAIESVKPIIDEIIVVDTGSTDSTIEIARSLGACIIEYEWDNNYSKIRNMGLSRACSEWILVLDADEEISRQDHAHIIGLTNDEKAGGWSLTQRTYMDDVTQRGVRPILAHEPYYGRYRGYIPNKICRFFRNSSAIRFESELHELVEPSIIRTGLMVRDSEIVIHHFSRQYLGGKPDKWRNYINSGYKELEKDPRQPRVHRDMGLSFIAEGDNEAAARHLSEALRLDPSQPLARYNLGIALARLGKTQQAMDAFKSVPPTDASFCDAHNNLGFILMQLGRVEEASSIFEFIQAFDPLYRFSYMNLAKIHMASQEYSKALSQLRELLKIDPCFEEHDELLCACLIEEAKNLFNQNLFPQALSLFKESLDHKPTLEAALNAALILSIMNSPETESMLDLAQSLDPEGRSREIIAKLRSSLKR